MLGACGFVLPRCARRKLDASTCGGSITSAARQTDTYISPSEHERIELETGVKHEWYDGQVFAMAGAQPAHNRISGNIYTSLDNQLDGQPCEPWNSDQQVKIPSRRIVPYPDITVACPPFEYDEQHRYALLNPVAIIEVLSPSTEKYDRDEKFDLYKLIPSLQDYILVASDRRRIQLFTRQADGSWAQRVASLDNQCVEITSISCRLCLDDVYKRLDLPVLSQVSEDAPERHED